MAKAISANKCFMSDWQDIAKERKGKAIWYRSSSRKFERAAFGRFRYVYSPCDTAKVFTLTQGTKHIFSFFPTQQMAFNAKF